MAVSLLIELTTGTGTSTAKPRPEVGPPSPWIETAASEPARLPMAARTSTHGPTPVSVVRVRTTVAPPAVRRAASRMATSKLKACSG